MKKLSIFDKCVLALTLVCLLVMSLWLMLCLRPSDGVRVQVERTADPMQNAQVRRAGSETDGLLEGEVMDLNTATVSDLTRLPGVGAVRAQDIVDWRDSHGGFDSVEQLMRVKGIGKATLDAVRPYVRVGN